MNYNWSESGPIPFERQIPERQELELEPFSAEQWTRSWTMWKTELEKADSDQGSRGTRVLGGRGETGQPIAGSLGSCQSSSFRWSAAV